jgi:cell division protein FtsA
MITGVGRTPSSGVRKSEVVDLENAKVAVKAALSEAEANANVSIREVLLVYSGGHIRHIVNRGTVNLLPPRQLIGAEDREEVLQNARAVTLPHDHELLHSIAGHYYLDDRRVVSPDGMEGNRLVVDMLILYGASNRLRNLFRLCEEAAVEVIDAAFGGLCCGLSVLSSLQKAAGVILIDLGAGTTDYVVYAEDIIARAGSLGVGGDHVTNDLSLGLSLSSQQAEKVKLKHASAMVDLGARERRIPIAPEGGFRARDVPSRDIQTIVHARMEEIFELVKMEIGPEILRGRFGAGVVLTGGGARLKRVSELASRVFEMPCHIGLPKDVSGLALPSESPEFSAVVGMLKYGARWQETGNRPGAFSNLFRRMFGKS